MNRRSARRVGSRRRGRGSAAPPPPPPDPIARAALRNNPGWSTIGTRKNRIGRSAVVADEGRHVDGLAPGDPGSRARVDSRDLAAGEENAEDQVSRLALPPATGRDGNA